MSEQAHTDQLEHSSGLRPLGEYPDHCELCRRVASCKHVDVVRIETLAGDVVTERCADCGVEVSP